MNRAVLTAAMLAALVLLSTAPAASAGPVSGGSGLVPPVAYDCRGWHHGQVRVGTVALSCFGTVVLRISSWKYWSGISARSAAAVLGVDTCQPDCETGKFRKFAATVIFYRARSHDGIRYYSRLKLQYRHDGPRAYTYRWARYPGATIPVWVGGPRSAGTAPRP